MTRALGSAEPPRALRVGAREIPYTVRASDRAARLRVVVTPESVEVIAPKEASAERIAKFVESRRRFIFTRSQSLRAEARDNAAQRLDGRERYLSGWKILFRGRRLSLRVQPADVEEVELTYATAFHVRVPRTLVEPDREREVRRVVTTWLRERAKDDAQKLVRHHAPALGIDPKALPKVRLSRARASWGTCGRDGTVHLHESLITAPRAILEYVVVHELCHLEHRHHGPTFWRRVESVLPDWKRREAWLRVWGR